MSSEKVKTRSADGVGPTGRQYCGERYDASASQALRSRRPQGCMETSRARTERPCCHPWSKGGGSVGEQAGWTVYVKQPRETERVVLIVACSKPWSLPRDGLRPRKPMKNAGRSLTVAVR